MIYDLMLLTPSVIVAHLAARLGWMLADALILAIKGILALSDLLAMAREMNLRELRDLDLAQLARAVGVLR